MKKMNQDKTPVRIKGMGNSLCITLDPSQPIDYLQKELHRLFKRMKHLAVNAKVILDVGELEGHEELVEKLGKFLKETFAVGSVSRPPVKQLPSEERRRKQDMECSWGRYHSDVLMLTGRVRAGQKVTAKNHLLILGDVNPGAEVLAGGDIFIMGTLRGTAIAGQPDNEEVIVLALDFQPIQIQIGKIVAAGLPPSPEKLAEFAHVENGTIVVEDYLEADPFGRLPWPQVR
ncbi:Septum site-determining protein [Desulfonema magnum]|uniref:Probable septum site-determining protein MinC n=2 Tax=Desulfonema magnum TaxID=45655 RepID=A0A975BUS8_9BACT|nr:Septum site-determining protein [Desulfonema magnum]